eukprot:XP_019073435.1 PREDICTED: uncharacterized protein LOC109121971 [Vitis vinifera]
MVALTGTKLGWLPKLSSHFAIRDLGDISYFLGIEVTRLPHVLHLNQQRYIHQLLERVDLLGAKSASTPSALGKLLSATDGDPLSALDATHYRSLVGALQYITLTRPEISFVVNRACQYMAHPTTSHLQAAKRILRYLKEAPVAFVFFFGTNLISWSSTKQRVVSRSSVESEYRALALLAAECDNISAAALAANSVFHARSKHIEIDLHFVRDKVLRKEFLIQYVLSTDQLADVFTKHVPSYQFSAARTRLSVVPSYQMVRWLD